LAAEIRGKKPLKKGKGECQKPLDETNFRSIRGQIKSSKEVKKKKGRLKREQVFGALLINEKVDAGGLERSEWKGGSPHDAIMEWPLCKLLHENTWRLGTGQRYGKGVGMNQRGKTVRKYLLYVGKTNRRN